MGWSDFICLDALRAMNILADDCTIQQSSNVINENRKDMNMPYCKTSEIYIIRENACNPITSFNLFSLYIGFLM
jgi:hypothetical protein